jgi:IclR family transcriptional regulator, KDG regulon repressor
MKISGKTHNDNGRYFVPAVEKAFAILELFASDNRGYGLSEVSRLLKLPISTVKALLHTIWRCGYVLRNGRGLFFLTMKILTEAGKALTQIELRKVAHEDLRQLTKATGLASALSVRDNDQVVYIDKIESTGHIMPVYYVGKRMPVHCAATGKALMAYLSDEHVEEIVNSVGLMSFTENTITSLNLLKKELDRVRIQGHSIDNEETALGLVGIAAAVFDHDSRVVGAVAAGGATAEVQQNIKSIITQVKDTALQISKKLGYQDTVVTKAYRPREPKRGPSR